MENWDAINPLVIKYILLLASLDVKAVKTN